MATEDDNIDKNVILQKQKNNKIQSNSNTFDNRNDILLHSKNNYKLNLNYNKFLHENIVDLKELSNTNRFKINSEEQENIKIKTNYLIETSKKIILNNTKILNNFNQNLYLINKLKNQDYSKNYKIKEKKIENSNIKLNNVYFFSNILDNILNNLKNNKNIRKNNDKKILNNHENLIKCNKMSNNPIQKIKKNKHRFRKNKFELNYLREYYEENSYKWDMKTIRTLSEKINLPLYSIYKWNWDRVNKIKKNDYN